MLAVSLRDPRHESAAAPFTLVLCVGNLAIGPDPSMDWLVAGEDAPNPDPT